jgi:hypothetical protein
MMEVLLDRLIRKIVLPKYAWIKNFKVSVNKKEKKDSYYVYYFIDEDLYDSLYERNRKELNGIKSETKELYDVLGPNKNDVFEGVVFFNNNN